VLQLLPGRRVLRGLQKRSELKGRAYGVYCRRAAVIKYPSSRLFASITLGQFETDRQFSRCLVITDEESDDAHPVCGGETVAHQQNPILSMDSLS
jgi:hypothetical protein